MRILGFAATAVFAAACAMSAASAQTTGSYNYEWTPPYSTGAPTPATGSTTQNAPVYQSPAQNAPVYQPAPQVYQPAPQVYQPAPPVYQSAPPVYGTQPQSFPQTAPTFPSFPTIPGTVPANPNPIQRPGPGAIEDTDSWTFNLPRYYPAIQACLRNVTTTNPVIANIQERGDRTVMLVGQGGSSDYKICRTGLRGTRVSPDEQTRNLPPAFYAPVGTSFTIAPDRPFQPVVSTDQRLVGWMVRTQPPSPFAAQFGADQGQAIAPVTVNTGN